MTSTSKKKFAKYYTLTKNSKLLKKLKKNQSIKVNKKVVLNTKKAVRIAKVNKHGKVTVSVKKLKLKKIYKVVEIRRIGDQFYAKLSGKKNF